MGFIVAAVIMLIVTIIRLIPKKKVSGLQNLYGDDWYSNIRALAISLRLPDNFGVGVSHKMILRPIKRAYNIIIKKIKLDQELYEYEKWIYENYYLILKHIDKKSFQAYRKLPHVNNEPRILVLARFILQNSRNNLTNSRISDCIVEFNKHTEIFYEEIASLKLALLTALAESVNEISKKVMHYYKMNRAARRKDFNPNIAYSDCYVYNYMLINKKTYISDYKTAIRIENAELSYTESLYENSERAAFYLRSMAEIDKLVRLDKILIHSNSYKKLNTTPLFSKMSFSTRIHYIEKIKELSEQANIPEKDTVDKIIALKDKLNVDISQLLFDNDNALKKYLIKGVYNPSRLTLLINRIKYLLINFCFVGLIAAMLCYFTGFGYYSVLLFIPFYIILYPPISHLMNLLYAYYKKPPVYLAMDYNDISEDMRTMVVISEYVTSFKDIMEAIEHMSEIGESNKFSNLTFSLLVDFPKSEQELSDNDREIIEKIKEYSDKLDSSRYNIYIRKKVKKGNLYVPYERKRGAILDLNDYFINRTEHFSYILNPNMSVPQYVLLLDDDNIMLPQSILCMVNAIAHPINLKYDLMTTSVLYNAYSMDTMYSRQFLNTSGIEQYPIYKDIKYQLYNRGIYTGKGIYRIKNYQNKLSSAFKDDRILSHDIIEGAILNTGLLNVNVYEDAPNSVVCNYERHKRWARGDLLLLPYIKRNRYDKHNNKVRTGIEPFYKEVILSNFINLLSPIMLFALSVFVLFMADFAIIATILLSIFIVSIVESIIVIRKNIEIRFKYTYHIICNLYMERLRYILLLPHNAIFNLAIILRTAYKALFKKDELLEWKTFKSSQSKSGIKKTINLFLPAYITTVLLAFILNSLFMYVYALLFIMFTLYLHYVSVKCDSHTLEDKKYLINKEKLDRLLGDKSYIIDNNANNAINNINNEQESNKSVNNKDTDNYSLNATQDSLNAATQDSLNATQDSLNVDKKDISSDNEKLININKSKCNIDRELLNIALKTFKFIKESVELNNGLVSDNLQIYPYLGYSDKTSPTNIGYSLLSTISAYELKIINYDQFYTLIDKIIDAINNLPKWYGNLYNWYNIKNREVITPIFISSVDSGNFISAMLSLKSYLINMLKSSDIESNTTSINALIERITIIINNTRLDKLYDNYRQLFYIGYNADRDEYMGHYDLYASEAQLLSLTAINLGQVGLEHWFSLGRLYSNKMGNTLLSWSGTMFEYLMPHLFYKVKRGSLSYKTAKNVAKIHFNTPCNGLSGISESGFYKFDDSLRYQYYAFGISALSLSSSEQKCIISPYSSFLALEYDRRYLKNIIELKNQGLLGDYGFYEAIDFSNNVKKIVMSYYAHHQGMIMCAIANYYTNAIKNSYMSLKGMQCSKLLLHENISYNKGIESRKNAYIYKKREEKGYEINANINKNQAQYNILNNSNIAYVSDERGINHTSYNGKYINRIRNNKRHQHGNFIYVKNMTTMDISSPTKAPLYDDEEYYYSFKNNQSYYENASSNLKLMIKVAPNYNAVVKKLTIENKSKERVKFKVYYYTELALNYLDADNSHQGFENMFIKTDFLNSKKAVIAEKRHHTSTDKLFYAVKTIGLNSVKAETNRFNFIGRNRDETDPLIFLDNAEREKLYPSLGDVLEPCCGIIGEVIVPPLSYQEVCYVEFISTSYNEVFNLIELSEKDNFYSNVEQAISLCNNIINKKTLSIEDYTLMNALAYLDLNGTICIDKLKLYDKEKLSRYMDIHHIPLVIEWEATPIKTLLSLISLLTKLKQANITINLIIIYRESNLYHMSVKNSIEKMLYNSPLYVTFIDKTTLGERLCESILNASYNVEEVLNISLTYPIDYKRIYKSLNFTEPQYESILSKFSDKIATGEGYIVNGNNYIVKPYNKNTLLPYTNVVCGEKGGFTISESGGGYTFMGNARERKLTVWNNDVVKDSKSEEIIIIKDNKYWSANSINSSYSLCKINIGSVEYITENCGIKSIVTVHSILNGAAKLYSVELINNNNDTVDIDIAFIAEFALGGGLNKGIIKSVDGNTLKIYNPFNNVKGYLRASSNKYFILNEDVINSRIIKNRVINPAYNTPSSDNTGGVMESIALKNNERKLLFYALSMDKVTIESIDFNNTDKLINASCDYFNNLSNITIKTSDNSLNALFNNYLMYQVVSARINGKCGYYQSGGAIGFRDQLQDCLALLYNNPLRVREHILLSAAHQYVEGDVQHWWHFEKLGVRTLITDDRLFLPYVAAQYITATGDKDILLEQVSYLKSMPLGKNERARMECPECTDYTESLYQHIIKAIDCTLEYGENNLIKIKGGDWNDALDAIGDSSRGESVWLSMFMVATLKECDKYFNHEDRKRYKEVIFNLSKAINQAGFNGRYYNRAFTLNGEWLGNYNCVNCKIDIISQAMAVIADISEDKNRLKSAMDEAEILVDKENRLIKLLSPPFNSNKFYGYISNYPEGIRENGGQYTHGAVWYIMAYAMLKESDKAYELIKLINPIDKCQDTDIVKKYKGEPYTLPADVYTGQYNEGRMGWSFYTGSAAWLYKVILENIIGIKLVKNTLEFNINLPDSMVNIEVEYRYKGTIYSISIEKTGKKEMFFNDILYNNVYALPLQENKGFISLKVTY